MKNGAWKIENGARKMENRAGKMENGVGKMGSAGKLNVQILHHINLCWPVDHSLPAKLLGRYCHIFRIDATSLGRYHWTTPLRVWGPITTIDLVNYLGDTRSGPSATPLFKLSGFSETSPHLRPQVYCFLSSAPRINSSNSTYVTAEGTQTDGVRNWEVRVLSHT